MCKNMRCNNCRWGMTHGMHFGCYRGGVWRRWVPLKEVNIPTACEHWQLGDVNIDYDEQSDELDVGWDV